MDWLLSKNAGERNVVTRVNVETTEKKALLYCEVVVHDQDNTGSSWERTIYISGGTLWRQPVWVGTCLCSDADRVRTPVHNKQFHDSKRDW